ncbi:MAG: hypothetical protein DRJ44_03620 [Thermoprotei archaeon]|nr:hypothetical protein [Thermoproteales archaeon]RLE76697.1 MAG: hypothetical protein DRJ44_03620 [Thermoprotei archaeon]
MRQWQRRGIRGFAVFYVNKDVQVVKIDLLLANIMLSKYKSRSQFKEYIKAFNEMMYYLGEEISEYFYEDVMCYAKSKPVLCRFFYSPENERVVYVMAAAVHTGIIKAIAKRLEKMGWKKKLLIEFTSLRQKTR